MSGVSFNYLNDRLDKKRHESQPDLVFFKECVFVLIPDRHHVAHVDFIKRGQHGRVLFGGKQMLGNAFADGGHRL